MYFIVIRIVDHLLAKSFHNSYNVLALEAKRGLKRSYLWSPVTILVTITLHSVRFLMSLMKSRNLKILEVCTHNGRGYSVFFKTQNIHF